MWSFIIVLLMQISPEMCEVFKGQDFWLSKSTERNVCKWMPTVIKQARKNKIDPVLLSALITVESGWRHNIVSSADACGLTQVIPKWTGGITRKYTCEQLKDPYTSITAGAKILKWWIDHHDGDIARGLCGYSSGFRCKGKKPLHAGMNYSKKVLSQKQKIERLYNNMKYDLDYMPSSQR